MANHQKYHTTKEELEAEKIHIEAAQQDALNFDVLYNAYYNRIVRFVYRRVDTKDDAFDITSQVFLNAMQNIKRYQFKGVPFSAWLFRIAINELNQFFNKNGQRALNLDAEGVNEIIEEVNDENKEELHTLLVRSLTELNEAELQMIEMRYFEKRPFKEIASILDITENNAKVKLYRILDKIKSMICSTQK